MSLFVYPVQKVVLEGEDDMLGVYGSANKAWQRAVEQLVSDGVVNDAEAKALLEDTAMKSKLRKGEYTLIKGKVKIQKTRML